VTGAVGVATGAVGVATGAVGIATGAVGAATGATTGAGAGGAVGAATGGGVGGTTGGAVGAATGGGVGGGASTNGPRLTATSSRSASFRLQLWVRKCRHKNLSQRIQIKQHCDASYKYSP